MSIKLPILGQRQSNVRDDIMKKLNFRRNHLNLQICFQIADKMQHLLKQRIVQLKILLKYLILSKIIPDRLTLPLRKVFCLLYNCNLSRDFQFTQYSM